MQQALLHWKKKINELEYTYDEIVQYKDSHRVMSEKVHISFLLEPLVVVKAEMDFILLFDELNSLFLWYVGDKWCDFPSLIVEYGVHLPETLQNRITAHVSFPDRDGQHSGHILESFIPPYADGGFKLDGDITLKLHRDITFKELSTLVTELQIFQQPLSKFYQALILFKNEATLFDKYLQCYLDSHVSHYDSLDVTSDFAGLPTVPSTKIEPPQGTSIDTFVNGLEHACDLIHSVMSGTVTYSEMAADDEEMLEKMDIEREFAILHRYAKLSNSEFDQSAVQSMLELPQFLTHCENIEKVCEQYHLTACLQDNSFQEMLKIMKENSSNEVRSKITPNGAKALMDRLKEILCLTEKSSSKCLIIFRAMMDSAPFYHFMNEKDFHGEQGQAMFRQQYQLITAQLQHEHYDEEVLNQLEPAFKAIGPFMNANRSFTLLMTAVNDFVNPEDNVMHLETVNANIMTIQKWFSRAEASMR